MSRAQSGVTFRRSGKISSSLISNRETAFLKFRGTGSFGEEQAIVKLLIVDDEKMICEEFRETLEHEGYQVDCALNGNEGLQKIQTNHYNLVFLDSAMPFMDGKKVLERIRHFSKVPVALITGFLPESKEKEILHLGATACLRKPLDLDRVKSLIRTVSRSTHS